MFIAVDAMSTDLPDDVRALSAEPVVPPRDTIDRGETHGGVQAEAVQPPSVNGATLDRWDVQSHQYTSKAQVETSILARLISGEAQVSHYGIVQEAKLFCIRTTKSDRRVEYGTAVRLSVAVLSTEFKASLTLPNIAATAQLSGLNARIALSVDGYVGPLANSCPRPTTSTSKTSQSTPMRSRRSRGRCLALRGSTISRRRSWDTTPRVTRPASHRQHHIGLDPAWCSCMRASREGLNPATGAAAAHDRIGVKSPL